MRIIRSRSFIRYIFNTIPLMNLNDLAIGHRTPFHVYVNKRLIMPNRIGGQLPRRGPHDFTINQSVFALFNYSLNYHHSMLKNKSQAAHEAQRYQIVGIVFSHFTGACKQGRGPSIYHLCFMIISFLILCHNFIPTQLR